MEGRIRVKDNVRFWVRVDLNVWQPQMWIREPAPITPDDFGNPNVWTECKRQKGYKACRRVTMGKMGL